MEDFTHVIVELPEDIHRRLEFHLKTALPKTVAIILGFTDDKVCPEGVFISLDTDTMQPALMQMGPHWIVGMPLALAGTYCRTHLGNLFPAPVMVLGMFDHVSIPDKREPLQSVRFSILTEVKHGGEWVSYYERREQQDTLAHPLILRLLVTVIFLTFLYALFGWGGSVSFVSMGINTGKRLVIASLQHRIVDFPVFDLRSIRTFFDNDPEAMIKAMEQLHTEVGANFLRVKLDTRPDFDATRVEDSLGWALLFNNFWWIYLTLFVACFQVTSRAVEKCRRCVPLSYYSPRISWPLLRSCIHDTLNFVFMSFVCLPLLYNTERRYASVENNFQWFYTDLVVLSLIVVHAFYSVVRPFKVE